MTPRFPAISPILRAREARRGFDRMPICWYCGKVKLVKEEYRAAGLCAKCLIIVREESQEVKG